MKETPACRKTGRGLLGMAAFGPALRVKIRLRPAPSHAGEGRRSGRRCWSSPAASKQRGPLCGTAFAGRSGTEMLCCAFFQNAVLRWPKRGFSKKFADWAPREADAARPGPCLFVFSRFCGIPLLQGRARLQGGGCGKAPFQRGCFFSAGCAPARADRLRARPAAWFSAAGTAPPGERRSGQGPVFQSDR